MKSFLFRQKLGNLVRTFRQSPAFQNIYLMKSGKKTQEELIKQKGERAVRNIQDIQYFLEFLQCRATEYLKDMDYKSNFDTPIQRVRLLETLQIESAMQAILKKEDKVKTTEERIIKRKLI